MSKSNQDLVEQTIAAVQPVQNESINTAKSVHATLTKPVGSLGRLEDVGVALCGVQQQVPPVVNQTHVVIFAADHGITKSHKLGPFPREVTVQMVHNFLNGGAAINAIAGVVGAQLAVVDMGVDGDLSGIDSDQFFSHKVAMGTNDIAAGPAMSDAQLYEALAGGIAMAEQCYNQGSQAVALGEMGIGNTTIASAVTAALLGLSPEEITGRGTGSDDETLARKVDAVKQALLINGIDASSGFDVLKKVGGYELAGIAGMSIGLARRRIAVVADGFISTAGLLAAVRMCPALNDYVFCGHQSTEPGHGFLLKALEKRPLLDLGCRLGEGTGACLSLSLLKSSAAIMSQMATFDSAGVEGSQH